MRHPDKAITDRASLLEVVRTQKFITVAMCHDNEPYLATVNHAFAEDPDRFYFHGSDKGRKADYIRANPLVWGQVLEDNGYKPGECEHAYRCVQFDGRARFVDDPADKLAALKLLITQQEPDSPRREQRLAGAGKAVAGVSIVRVDVLAWTGKESK
jgi:uncharacterized protein